ncbi:MAG TPA: hypothetical protein PKA13_24755 [Geminicoccaceae bacterium]|nr:hypothetical protein [Geminicoccus sp.]HMU53009.1 hypothetical protein [Geminicoccaceae bacterium]
MRRLAALGVSAAAPLRRSSVQRIVPDVRWTAVALRELDDATLQDRLESTRPSLWTTMTSRDAAVQALAFAIEAATRKLGLAPFDCQIAGSFALMRGMVAEMETGEGKTLTSALAAAACALGGLPVHVVTANDYLVERDATWLAPFYHFLGLRAGMVLAADETEARIDAYGCEVVHVTAKELVFDYLRDRLMLGRHSSELQRQLNPVRHAEQPQLRQRGLGLAIIDEADSILIDEARQPLVISQLAPPRIAAADLSLALGDARSLERDHDFSLLASERRAELTSSGSKRLAGRIAGRGGRWDLSSWREELVRQGLCALHLYRRGEDYVVRDGRIEIVDEFTGRIVEGRAWSAGLHEMIEHKEGCPPQGARSDVARLTYQRFFRRYRHLAGMTGTAREVGREMWSVYGTPVVRLPTNRPLRRIRVGVGVLNDEPAKWEALARKVQILHADRRPVLIGTRTLTAARAASEALDRLGLPHVVLSAEQDAEEATVVAQAGRPGRITIATNMAGRGTDIRLGPGVVDLGGLHVAMSEMHEAGRIDRQLAGRCARQGDPGSYEVILSWQDPLVQHHLPGWLLKLATQLPEGLRNPIAPSIFALAQRRAERLHARMRDDLLRNDDVLDDLLAFAGPRP